MSLKSSNLFYVLLIALTVIYTALCIGMFLQAEQPAGILVIIPAAAAIKIYADIRSLLNEQKRINSVITDLIMRNMEREEE
jgi:succinate-acetate transporter protein